MYLLIRHLREGKCGYMTVILETRPNLGFKERTCINTRVSSDVQTGKVNTGSNLSFFLIKIVFFFCILTLPEKKQVIASLYIMSAYWWHY